MANTRRNLRATIRAVELILLLSISAGARGDEPVLGDFEERIIRYEATAGFTDPVSRLQKQLAAGKVRLRFDRQRGYLPALLKALDVPVSSQGLVFSKTSSQAQWTSPRTPRAIYYGDATSVAWVPGAPVIDIVAVDSERGPIFYTLEQKLGGVPRFERQTDCMRCHLAPRTMNVPGLVVGSFFTASNGVPLAAVDDFVVGHQSPFRARWGGWYVSGTHAGEFHLGNSFSVEPVNPETMNLLPGANVTDLRRRFDSAQYLSPHSDLVALLVLEHQVQMQNLITLANYETRYALAELARTGAPVGEVSMTAAWPQRRIAVAGERLLEYLLFRNEAALKGPVRGAASFAREFQRTGPRASGGRSLRQLDLTTRLFRHPCSYLIYSPAFDALPVEMKAYLWRRLEQILTGQDQSGTYRGLTAADRQSVLEILRETKPEFAAWLRK
jgi:hypothetical protein